MADADEPPRSAAVRSAVRPREREHVLSRRVRLEPAEAFVREVDRPERRLGVVSAVEIANEGLDARVIGIGEQVPVERLRRLAPLALLGELPTHEEELLAGMGPHVAVERPQVLELLPAIAGHFSEQRALAVDD